MKYIEGKNRNQVTLFPVSLDESLDKDNQVRLIDLFVESLELEKMGFRVDFIENGRPAYHPKDLMKLYLYGYMNRVRSSRELEKETKRNIEVIWLLKGLSPDHNTISNFHRDHPKAIKQVFRATVDLAKNFDLIGGKLLAGDSTKLRAQNSKKNNFNQKKIDRHLAYIESKLAEYESLLGQVDQDHAEKIQDEIQKHQIRKQGYQQLQKQLEASGETQISTTDPHSRQMITRNNIAEVAYNVQTTVDAENNIPIDFKVTNVNDSNAMGEMLQRATEILETNEFTALYDKGYHTGSEFKKAHDLGIEVMVAIPKVANQAPDPDYNVENFDYHAQGDFYTCPQGHELHTKGSWHQAATYQFKRYTTTHCKTCPVKELCSKAKNGKGIQRSEYTQYIQNNKERIDNQPHYYTRRQAIVEHPYGTIKRQWGFSYIMTKKYITRAESDVGLIFTSYNLRRLINILGENVLKSYIIAIYALFLSKIRLLGLKLSTPAPSKFLNKLFQANNHTSTKRLILMKKY